MNNINIIIHNIFSVCIFERNSLLKLMQSAFFAPFSIRPIQKYKKPHTQINKNKNHVKISVMHLIIYILNDKLKWTKVQNRNA